jgi:NADH-quinone oxidoreductase subunit H
VIGALALSSAAAAPWTTVALIALIKSAILLFILLTLAAYAVFMERIVIARLQARVGPNRAGPFGLLQPLADFLKLLTKEDSRPPFVDKWLFFAAPMLIMVTTILTFAVIPFGADPIWQIANVNIAALVFLALSSLGVYSIVLAGWSSNSKYATLGGLRATAQMISYELSMGMSVLACALMAGSFSLVDIVNAQRPFWFIIIQPIGFVVFLVAIIAESRRTPFDLPEAENELVAGFHTEYSSMKFALFFLGEYVGVMLLSAVLTLLYLGGWSGPWLPDPIWMCIKIFFLVFFFIWIRATYPRFRYDHLMELGWKWLIPLSVLNLIISAILVLAFPNLIPHAVL